MNQRQPPNSGVGRGRWPGCVSRGGGSRVTRRCGWAARDRRKPQQGAAAAHGLLIVYRRGDGVRLRAQYAQVSRERGGRGGRRGKSGGDGGAAGPAGRRWQGGRWGGWVQDGEVKVERTDGGCRRCGSDGEKSDGEREMDGRTGRGGGGGRTMAMAPSRRCTAAAPQQQHAARGTARSTRRRRAADQHRAPGPRATPRAPKAVPAARGPQGAQPSPLLTPPFIAATVPAVAVFGQC